jgi:hypothetical protein
MMAAAFGECGAGGEGGSTGGGSRGAGGGEGGSPLPSPCVAAHAHLDGGVPTVVGRVQQLLQRRATALKWCGGPAPATDAGEEGRRSAPGRGEEGGRTGGWRQERTGFLCNLPYNSTFRIVIEFSRVAKEILNFLNLFKLQSSIKFWS